MRHFFTTGFKALFLFIAFFTTSYAQTWQAALRIGTPANTTVTKAVAADASGNVYIAGIYSGPLTLGAITLSGPQGNFDVFVTKWSPTTNTFVWVQQAGGAAADDVTAIAVNGSNVYITGSFQATANFGTTTLSNANGNSSFFVAKIADSGNSAAFVWAQTGSALNGTGPGVGLAVSGTSVYVTGQFSNATTFGSIVLPRTPSGIFIAKLTDAGSSASFVWALRVENPLGGSQGVTSIAANGSNVYIAGNFGSPNGQGVSAFGPVTLTSTGASDTFVAKIIDSGSSAAFVWAQQGGGPMDDSIQSIAVNGNAVYLTGTFEAAPVRFGSIVLTNSVTTFHAFVGKLVDAGATATYSWAVATGGAGYTNAQTVCASGANVYVTGVFDAAIPVTFGNITLANFTATDLYVTKLLDSGTSTSFVWATRAVLANTGQDIPSGMAVSGATIYLTGNFNGLGSPALYFDSIVIPGNGRSADSGFVAQLLDQTVTASRSAAPLLALSIYPNPAQRIVNLILPTSVLSPSVFITDAQGRTARTCPVPAHATTATLDLTGLAPGLYVVRCGAASGKLVVE